MLGHPSDPPVRNSGYKSSATAGAQQCSTELVLNTEKSEKSTISGHPYKPTLGSGSSRDYRDINTSRGKPWHSQQLCHPPVPPVLPRLQAEKFGVSCKREWKHGTGQKSGEKERADHLHELDIFSTVFCVFYVQGISRQTNTQSFSFQ